MTAAYHYEQLALGWSPESKSDGQFRTIAIVVLGLLLAIGVVLSSIDLPTQQREARTFVPERIAQFILEKERPKPAEPKPKPKPAERPLVRKTVEKPSELKRPLTTAQKMARDKAADSGLLALRGELAGLMDTSNVSRELGRAVVSHGEGGKAASHDTAVLSADIGKGSGGVDGSSYSSTVASSNLTQREITQVKQSLLASGARAGASEGMKSRSGNVRAEEEITIVLDQNKSMLYSIYNRERRKNPNLKGKIVLEITIAPNGKVTAIRVVSSELSDPQLEKRLIARIKLLKFGEQDVKPVTVTFPIEFLPS